MREQIQNQILTQERSWILLAKEHLQLQECFGELQGGGLCFYNQPDLIVFKNKRENYI